MKKIIVLLLLMVFMCGCGSADENYTVSSEEIQKLKDKYPSLNKETEVESETVEEQAETVPSWDSWDYIMENCPIATYDEIEAGKYNGQYVVVECLIDNSHEVADLLFADVWYESEKYGFVRDSEVLDWEEVYCKRLSLQQGNTVQVCVYVDNVSSFGFAYAQNIRITDSKHSLDDVKAFFKQESKIMDYKAVLRNPDDYKNSNLTCQGEVLQIISESDSAIEFLLRSDEDQVVYVYYYREGTSRILEGDKVTVYGTFYILETYTTLLGTSNTVPRLSVYYLELGE